MSYIIKNPNELFIVTKNYGENNISHIIMNKREVQERLKSPFAHLIIDIRKFKIGSFESVSKKYFLPKNWERINKKSVNYQIWKQIAESED